MGNSQALAVQERRTASQEQPLHAAVVAAAVVRVVLAALVALAVVVQVVTQHLAQPQQVRLEQQTQAEAAAVHQVHLGLTQAVQVVKALSLFVTQTHLMRR